MKVIIDLDPPLVDGNAKEVLDLAARLEICAGAWKDL